MRTLSAVLVSLTIASTALAIDPFYEAFDYESGVLTTVTSGAWTQKSSDEAGEEWMVDSTLSLGYEKNGNVLQTSGGLAKVTMVNGGASRSEFGFESKMDSGTVWVSFLAAQDDGNWLGSSLKLQNGLDSYTNVSMGTGATKPPLFRTYVNGNGNTDTVMPPSNSTAQADLVAMELIFADVDGDDDNSDGVVNFYLNPDPGADSPADSATWTQSVIERNKYQMGFKAFQLERWQANGLFSYIDEIRVGNTYAEVTPLANELLAGDANGDGQVDGNDLISVEENFGATGNPGIPGDANGDGQVDGNDLISVEENFGATSGAASVPEPATIVLMSLCGAALLRTRR